MPMRFQGSGAIQGLAVGGLPDGIVTASNFSGGQTGTAPGYLVRAWVYFSVSGGAANVTASGNVTSLTYNAAGNYTLNFATAMSDTNYAVVVGCIGNTGVGQRRTHRTTDVNTSGQIVARTTSGTRINICDVNATQIDPLNVAAVVIR